MLFWIVAIGLFGASIAGLVLAARERSYEKTVGGGFLLFGAVATALIAAVMLG